MAPNAAPVMRFGEFYEPFVRNRLSSQIGCALSEELSDILKCPGRWINVQGSMNGQDEQAMVLRQIENLRTKIDCRPRAQLEISLKLLLCTISTHNIENAVQMALRIFDVTYIDKLIILAEPFIEEAEELSEVPQESKKYSFFAKFMLLSKDKKAKKFMKNVVHALMKIWPCLENLHRQKRILKIGLADIDSACFKTLFKSVNIPPTILELSEDSIENNNVSFLKFCEKNKIDVLGNHNPETSSDSADFDSLPGYGLDWTSIYKIRLPESDEFITKGYIAGKTQSLFEDS